MRRKPYHHAVQRSKSPRKVYLRAERRGESRHPFPQNGTYLKNLNIEETAFEQGRVTMLNESVNGALLQMSHSFNDGDIIEIDWPQSPEQPAIILYEVRWSHALEVRADCNSFEIGCRLLFTTEWLKTSAPTEEPTPPDLTVLPTAARPRLLID